MAEPAVEQGAADVTCAGSGGGDKEATAVEQPAATEVAAEAPAREQEAEDAALAPEEEVAAARGGDGGGACGRPRWRSPRARSARYTREILQARRRCSAASAR